MTPKLRTKGKFFFEGSNKVYLKGVSYGPFQEGSHGSPFPEAARVEMDFRLMRALGVNCIRTYTIPPNWLLEAAELHGIWTMVGIPWAEHVTFLDSHSIQMHIRNAIAAGVEACRSYRTAFAYLIGNEISPDIIRWHGPHRVEDFLGELSGIVRRNDPDALVSYASFPSTEFLELDCIDFYCFNVYLHHEEDFRKYLARLQNIAGSNPLVLSEFGADSSRHGESEQAQILKQKLHTSFIMGAAGTVIFSWTDEWFTGGHAITDWAFGLVTSERVPKQSFEVAKSYYTKSLPPPPSWCPKVSVVVCAYNAERTIEGCLAALLKLDYADHELIIVNDGSTDRTLEICQRCPSITIISQQNMGLSHARNVGMEAAVGEIIAYTDADCQVDPDWLTYLVHAFAITGNVAVGGPNFPPPEDDLVPTCVAVSPGGPTHVLLDDMEAEHIAGCNMAFRADVLRSIGGFDAQFRTAGDDIDICWRLQDAGYTIAFSSAAQVWHFRRNTIRDYFQQQRGYGKAEALVFFKHPERFNLLGQARWLGRIYGDMTQSVMPSRSFIYSGVFGMAPFQTLYRSPASVWTYLPQTLEWNLFSVSLILLLVLFGLNPIWGFIPFAITLGSSLVNAWQAPLEQRFQGIRSRLLITFMILGGPLVRSWERYQWRARINRYRLRELAPLPKSNLKAKVSPYTRSLYVDFWSEDCVERDVFLKDMIHLLSERKYFINVQDGWSPWDFKIQQGLWSTGIVQTCTEHHGGNRRLLRVRARLGLSRLSKCIGWGWLILTLLLLIMRHYTTLPLLMVLGVVMTVLASIQLTLLGKAMLRTFALSAERLGLKLASSANQPRR